MTRALHAQLTGGRLLAALIVAGALAMRRSRPRHRAAPRPASRAGCALPSVHDREPELPRRRFPASQRGVRAAGLQGLRLPRQRGCYRQPGWFQARHGQPDDRALQVLQMGYVNRGQDRRHDYLKHE